MMRPRPNRKRGALVLVETENNSLLIFSIIRQRLLHIIHFYLPKVSLSNDALGVIKVLMIRECRERVEIVACILTQSVTREGSQRCRVECNSG